MESFRFTEELSFEDNGVNLKQPVLSGRGGQ
jgi:hypothetical protein